MTLKKAHIQVKPTQDGGRFFVIDSPWLFIKAEVKPDGCIEVASIEARDPSEQMKVHTRGVGDNIAKDTKPSGIGDRYKQALSDRFGGVSCGACEIERRRLNNMSVRQVQDERDSIVEATVNRAMNNSRWQDRIKVKMGDMFAPETLRRMIGRCLDEAINA